MVSLRFAAVSVVSAAIVYAQSYCKPYSIGLDIKGYPPPWVIATTNTLYSAEFLALKATIDWSKIPNISVKTDATITSYDTKKDPDCWWTATQCTSPKHPGLPSDIFQCNEANTLGLTFDDGPNCTEPVLYDFLASHNQKADLFYIGSNVLDWPKEAVLGFKGGHAIHVHTWSHPYLTMLSNYAVLSELYYTKKVIKQVIGVTPLYFRAPYGDIDDRVRWIAAQLNLSSIQWNIDSNDWQMMPAGDLSSAQVDKNFQKFVDMVSNGTFSVHGAILLEHELDNGTISKAEEWYPKLKEAFSHVMPVMTCANISSPYVEKNISFPSFAEFINGSLSDRRTSFGLSLIFSMIVSALYTSI